MYKCEFCMELKANPLGGRTGHLSALASRWKPSVLIQRIRWIANCYGRISVHCEDASAFIEEAYWDESAHIGMAVLLDHLYKGVPGADILLSYDDAPSIRHLYEFARKYITR